jgi:hypothetical protein
MDHKEVGPPVPDLAVCPQQKVGETHAQKQVVDGKAKPEEDGQQQKFIQFPKQQLGRVVLVVGYLFHAWLWLLG